MLKLLVFGDVHAPFHDKQALACMLNAMAWWKPDATICMGDLFDFYACSFYDTAPSRWKRLKDELEDARNVVGDINSIAGADRTFIKGNHEDRLDRYIAKSARALDGLVDFANAVGLDKSWQVVEYGNFIKIGKVLYTHDLDYAGPYFAQRAVMDARHSIVIGHVHRIGMCVEGDITGRHRVGASFGWLGDVKHADYKHRLKAMREWAHGFGLGYLDEKTGLTYFTAVPILKGVCCVEGKVFKG